MYGQKSKNTNICAAMTNNINLNNKNINIDNIYINRRTRGVKINVKIEPVIPRWLSFIPVSLLGRAGQWHGGMYLGGNSDLLLLKDPASTFASSRF